MNSKVKPRRSRLVALVAFATAGVLMGALPAYADTSQATASAATLTVVGQPALSTGTVTAANDGTTETTTGNPNPALSLLGTQTLLTAGVLVQQARAFNDGTSAACAGVVGPGGIVSVGPGGTCAVSGAAPNGVTLLSGVVTADAILERCVASSDGTATAHAQIVNAKLLGVPINLTLPSITVPGVLTLTIAPATTTGTGGAVTATALHLDALSLLGPPTAALDLGKVSCGPNAKTQPISAFPTKGLPIAGGVVALAGGALYIRKRRSAARAAA